MVKKIYNIAFMSFVLLGILNIHPAADKVSAADLTEIKATDLDRINPGTAAPDFNLESVENARVKLSDYQNLKNVILIFYRGYW